MKEELLYFIWHLQYFRKENLTTEEGQSLQIVAPGTHNAHAGPDFSQARLFIDEIEWRGAVEIHIKASDWEQHGHQYDAAYKRGYLARSLGRRPGSLPTGRYANAYAFFEKIGLILLFFTIISNLLSPAPPTTVFLVPRWCRRFPTCKRYRRWNERLRNA